MSAIKGEMYMMRLRYFTAALLGMPFFFYAASDDEHEFKLCFEKKTISVKLSDKKQRFYDTAHAIALLDDWERMVFQVAIFSSTDAAFTYSRTKKIRDLFYAMHTQDEAAALSDEREVLRRVLSKEAHAKQNFDVEYRHHQFFFNVDQKKFEQSIPLLFVPEVLQSVYEALPLMESEEAMLGRLKAVVEKDLNEGTVKLEVPVIVINKEVCEQAYRMYQCFMKWD